MDEFCIATDTGPCAAPSAGQEPASTKIGKALADALDEAVEINDLLLLLHLAGMSLGTPEAGAIAAGAEIAQQHASSLRRHLHAAKQELSGLRQELTSTGAAP